MTPYSALKAAWHIDRIRDLRDGKQIAPAQIQLVLSDLCNQNCHFCAYRMDTGLTSKFFGGNPNRKIPTANALKILNDAAEIGVDAIQFTGGGEPTVHPDFDKILRYAQDLGFKTGLVTNGVRINKGEHYENLDWIRVSVDAGTPGTYERIRERPHWERVMSNLDYIGTLEKPVTGIGFVITPENFTEILAGAEVAADKFIDYIRFSAMFSTEGTKPYRPIYAEIKDRLRFVKERYRRSRTKIYDLFGDRIEDLVHQSPDYDFCGYQHFNLYIGGDQKLYRCCVTAYTPRGEVADLSTTTLKEALLGERDVLGNFDARGCSVCQFNNKNEVINYMLTQPVHVEFV